VPTATLRAEAASTSMMVSVGDRHHKCDQQERRRQGVGFGTPPDRRKSTARLLIARTPTGSARSSAWNSGEWFDAAVAASMLGGVTPSPMNSPGARSA